jgi:hypothetical protein
MAAIRANHVRTDDPHRDGGLKPEAFHLATHQRPGVGTIRHPTNTSSIRLVWGDVYAAFYCCFCVPVPVHISNRTAPTGGPQPSCSSKQRARLHLWQVASRLSLVLRRVDRVVQNLRYLLAFSWLEFQFRGPFASFFCAFSSSS